MSKSDKRMAVVILLLVIIKLFILNGVIPSASMENTLKIGDGVVVNKQSYLFKKPERFDIVVFRKENHIYIKRIIGVPGDEIVFKDKDIFVNNELLKEDYLKEGNSEEPDRNKYVVPNNSYFVMGDNRNNSQDSRYWLDPYINFKDIKGKAKYVYNLEDKMLDKLK